MRALAVMFVLAAASGCSDPQGGGGTVPFDATVDLSETAAEPPRDATLDAARDATLDRPRDVPRDAVATQADAEDAAVEDVVIDPGMCGPSVRACLCGCGGTGACQNTCIARSDDCSGCIYLAATRCCRDESTVFEDCIDRNMCADDGCVRLRCADEQRRFETCFAAMQMSDDACRAEMRTCLGSDYPMIRCVQP